MRPGFYLLGLLLVLASFGKASAAAPATCPDGRPVPVVTPGPPVAPVSLRDVQTIRIQSSVGFKAYDDVFERRDGVWVRRNDGYRVSSADLAALLKALSRTPATQFDFSRARLDRPHMLAALNKAEENLYEARSLPAARTAFETYFFDLPMFERWIDKSWFDPCSLVVITDYYPHLDVTISAGNRRIKITSGSQRAFMLPLWISDGRGMRPTFDPGLAAEIAKVMRPGAAVKSILWNDDTPINWADAIAQSNAVKDAIAKTGTTQAQAMHVAHSMGLALDYRLSADGTSWTGAVWLPQMPRVRYPLQGWRPSNAAFAVSLERPRDALQALLKARWFISAMRQTPSATAELSDAESWKQGFVQQLYVADRLGVADCLAADPLPGTVVNVQRGSDDGSRWFVLANGDMLLRDFTQGKTVFHFGQKWYERLPVLSSGYDGSVTAALVRSDGSLVQSC